MPPRQPIHTEIDDFNREMQIIYARLSREIRRRLRQGETPTEAVNNAVKAVGIITVLRGKIPDRQINLIEKSLRISLVADPGAKRKFFLNNFWRGENLTLSQRIAVMARFPEIKSTIRIGLRDAKAWNSLAKSLTDRDLIKADLAGHIHDLENSARRVMRGDKGAFNEYRRAVRKSQRQIETLARNGAPTKRLKRAYQAVIRATESQSEQALDNAIDRSIQAKARHNAERIARTEKAKAYGQGTYQGAIDDPDVIGIRYDLSARHVDFDICDFHTQANLFGMGEGVYPLDNLPPYPFHPHCTCVMSYVFEGEAEPQRFTNKRAQNFIEKLPKNKQQAILGVQGQKNFQRAPTKWQENLSGYQGHRNINTLRELKGIKEAA